MRLRVPLAFVVSVAATVVLMASALPTGAQSPARFDLQSDALGLLTFLDSGTGAAVPVDPKFPHAFSQVRQSGGLADARGVGAWFDPGFLLGAAFACLPECPPANPWDSTVAQTFWPQPPPQEEEVGVQAVSSPVLSSDSAKGRSVSEAGPASTNSGSVANLVIGASDAPVFRIARVEAASDSSPDGGGTVTTSKAVVSNVSGPGELSIDSVTVTTEIRSDGTPAGTEVTADVLVAGVSGGGQSFDIPADALQGALDPLNRVLGPAGVQVRPPTTCTNADCEEREVVGFDFISGTQFCSGGAELVCALATGPEIEFAGGAGTPFEGQRHVLTLGRTYAQGFASAAAVEGSEAPPEPLPVTGGGAAAGLGVAVLGVCGWLLADRPRQRRGAR